METRFQIDAPPSRPLRISTWAILVWLGWIAFELTANELLACVIVCCKFGWNDLRTGWWLRRVDPLRPRGRTCFWFYAASGLWKITVTAVVLTIAISIILVNLQGNAGRLQDILGAMSLQFIAGFLLASAATLIGVALALRRDVRVWISRDVHGLRRQRCWPLPVIEMSLAGPRRWWVTAFVVIGLMGSAATLLVVALFAMMMLADGGPVAGIMAALWGGLFIFGLPIGGLLALDLVARRVLARWPYECWPEPLLEAASPAYSSRSA